MSIFKRRSETDEAAVVARLEDKLDAARRGADAAYETASREALAFETGETAAGARRDAAMAEHDRHVARQSELEAALRAARKDAEARAAQAAEKAARDSASRARAAIKAHNAAAAEVDEHLAKAAEAIGRCVTLQADIRAAAPGLTQELYNSGVKFHASVQARFRQMPNFKMVGFWSKEDVDWAPHCVQPDRVGDPE